MRLVTAGEPHQADLPSVEMLVDVIRLPPPSPCNSVEAASRHAVGNFEYLFLQQCFFYISLL